MEEIRLSKDRVRHAPRKISFTVKENALERRDKAERIERKILSKESTDEITEKPFDASHHPALKKDGNKHIKRACGCDSYREQSDLIFPAEGAHEGVLNVHSYVR